MDTRRDDSGQQHGGRKRRVTETPAPTPHAAGADQRPAGQIVLVFQGGEALGAYQVGVYQALHEAGIEPDWVIGTSIGAINAAIIAGNERDRRMAQLAAFWASLECHLPFGRGPLAPNLVNPWANLMTLTHGVAGFFTPNPNSWWGLHTQVGVERAAFYSTAPLRDTLNSLIDFELPNRCEPRLSVGAVNARTGAMRYFDSRFCPLRAEHVMASGALPPAFPAIRIDGEPYWDGGVYSNTPIEAVFDDNPRKSSTIFSVHLWNPTGSEPDTIWQVMNRQKDIQYASRAASHIARHQQIHHLRHVIKKIAGLLPAELRDTAQVRDLESWGCRTTMQIVQLVAPRLMSEDQTKDIDFTPEGIHTRWQAGYADTKDAILQAPWLQEGDPLAGVVLYEQQSPQQQTT